MWPVRLISSSSFVQLKSEDYRCICRMTKGAMQYYQAGSTLCGSTMYVIMLEESWKCMMLPNFSWFYYLDCSFICSFISLLHNRTLMSSRLFFVSCCCSLVFKMHSETYTDLFRILKWEKRCCIGRFFFLHLTLIQAVILSSLTIITE